MPNLAEFTQRAVAASGAFCAYRSARPLKGIVSDAIHAKTELEVFSALPPSNVQMPGDQYNHRAGVRHHAAASLKTIERLRAFTLAAAPPPSSALAWPPSASCRGSRWPPRPSKPC